MCEVDGRFFAASPKSRCQTASAHPSRTLRRVGSRQIAPWALALHSNSRRIALFLFLVPVLARHGIDRLLALALQCGVYRRQRRRADRFQLCPRVVELLFDYSGALDLRLRWPSAAAVDRAVEFAEVLAQLLFAGDHAAFLHPDESLAGIVKLLE